VRAKRWVAAAALVVAGLSAVGGRAPAEAAFPGRNGRIVFSSDRAENRAAQLYGVPAAGGPSRNLTRTPTSAHFHPTPSPDGSLIAFIAFDGGSELWTMRADGSERRRLAAASNAPLSWSPDGRWIVYGATDGSLKAVAADGTQTVPIAARGERPSWSPDGRSIAFVRDAQYFVVTNGVEEQLAVGFREPVSVPSTARAPSWSPDSRRLVIAPGAPDPLSFPTGRSDLYVVDVTSGAARQLTATPHVDEGAARWSPDGSQIAFVRRTEEPPYLEVDLIDPDGGGERRFLLDASLPAWSPDGRAIAFTRDGHLFVADVATASARRVTRHSARERVVFGGVWAPDGRTLYVDKAAENVRDLFTVDPAGRTLRRLTTSPSWDSDPRWSPDGGRVVFSRGNPFGVLYVVNANGRGLRRIGCPARATCDSPSWSPDGRRIAFTLSRSGVPASVAVMGVAGGRPRVLARGFEPAWSPDGRRIAFWNMDGNLVEVRPDGRGRRTLVRADPEWFVNRSPAWSPDGRRLAFVRARFACAGCEVTESWTLLVAAANGTRPAEVAASVVSRPAWSPNGRSLVIEQAGDLKIMNVDGSGLRPLTSGGAVDLQPDWQPLPRRR
jgi:TolB protein